MAGRRKAVLEVHRAYLRAHAGIAFSVQVTARKAKIIHHSSDPLEPVCQYVGRPRIPVPSS